MNLRDSNFCCANVFASAHALRGASKNPPTKGNAMNQRIAMGLTLLVGVAIGATAIQGLHAQAKPPGYAVIAIRNIKDPDTFKTLLPKAPAAVQAFGGKFIVRTENITGIDGTAPKRYVVIAFESVEKAKAWSESAAQKEVDAIRAKSTDSLSFIVEGMSN
jgi:uncharacterized protein (DUF1330 family)